MLSQLKNPAVAFSANLDFYITQLEFFSRINTQMDQTPGLWRNGEVS